MVGQIRYCCFNQGLSYVVPGLSWVNWSLLCSQDISGLGKFLACVGRKPLSQSKINDLYLIFARLLVDDHDIARFEISVHDPLRVCECQAVITEQVTWCVVT
jgi:hypothetical protein